MEQFAIWNLLKTMLNNAPSPSSQDSKLAENPAKTPSNSPNLATADNLSSGQEQTEFSPSTANACEEYLLRHERLMSGRKR